MRLMGDRQCLSSSLNPLPRCDRPVLGTKDIVLNKMGQALDLGALRQHQIRVFVDLKLNFANTQTSGGKELRF